MTSAYIRKLFYNSRNDKFDFGLFSDMHLEANDCDVQRLKRDLAIEKENNSRILINGDTFDAIMPTDRKRHSPSMESSHCDAKINEAEEYGFEILRPFVDYIDYIGMGNHETTLLRYNHYDIIRGLVSRLNSIRDKSLPPIFRGGYQGYIRYMIQSKNKGGTNYSYTIFHHHGAGGSAPVTKGMIDFNRMVTSHTADLYWAGHKHTGIDDPYIMRDRLTQQGNIEVNRCIGTFTPGYKHPKMIRDYSNGYEIEYSDQFYNLQAQGYKRLTLSLCSTSGEIAAEIVGK